jgi:hypothetical protein
VDQKQINERMAFLAEVCECGHPRSHHADRYFDEGTPKRFSDVRWTICGTLVGVLCGCTVFRNKLQQ